jgi:hypothetical protein
MQVSSQKRRLNLSSVGKFATCLKFQLLRGSPNGHNCHCCKYLRLRKRAVPAASEPPFLGSCVDLLIGRQICF